MSVIMDIANKVAFYSALGIGTPIILLSFRCIFVLFKKEYRKNAFCRIFIASLIANALTFVMLMHNLRFPGMGFFPGYYEAVKNGWWLPLQSYVTRILYMLSLMFSFLLSLNRVTSLYLHEKLNEKIWRHFFFIYVPLAAVFNGIIVLDIILNKAEYIQSTNADGQIIFRYMNYNLTRNWDSYWMAIECVLDLICNILIIMKFIRIRMGTAKRTPFENSLYLIGFASFLVHTGTSSMQIALRYNVFPPSTLGYAYLVSNTIYDITLLLPTVAILALTKEIRNEVKRFFLSIFHCFNQTRKVTSVTTTKVTPSTQSVTAFTTP